MGWTDSHLHVFEVGRPKGFRIECPFAEPELGEEIRHWTTELKLKRVFKERGISVAYRYDLGDDWLHEVLLEDNFPRPKGKAFPICVAGERSCPPEDCGGVEGYAECLESLHRQDPEDERLVWLGDWRPDGYEPEDVVFEQPRTRFLQSCGED